VVTSSPILLNQVTIGSNGTAELVSLVPVDILPAGEHNFRIVGVVDLGNAIVGADGQPQLTDAQLAALGNLDEGTVGHLMIAGVGKDGEQVLSLVSSGLATSSIMWTIWLVIAVGLIAAIIAYILRFESPARMLLSTLAILGAAPAIVIGLVENSVSFSIIGALIGFGFAAVANWTPFKSNPSFKPEPVTPAMA
jgi:hypothetical protein